MLALLLRDVGPILVMGAAWLTVAATLICSLAKARRVVGFIAVAGMAGVAMLAASTLAAVFLDNPDEVYRRDPGAGVRSWPKVPTLPSPLKNKAGIKGSSGDAVGAGLDIGDADDERAVFPTFRDPASWPNRHVKGPDLRLGEWVDLPAMIAVAVLSLVMLAILMVDDRLCREPILPAMLVVFAIWITSWQMADISLQVVLMEAGAIASGLLLAAGGMPEQRRAGLTWLGWQVVAGGLSVAAFATLVAGPAAIGADIEATFDIPELRSVFLRMVQTSAAAHAVADKIVPLVGLLLLVSAAIRLSLWGVHVGFSAIAVECRPSLVAFATAGVSLWAWQMWERWIATCCAPSLAEFGPVVRAMAEVGLLWFALLALSQTDLRKTIAAARLMLINFAIASLATGTASGLMGGRCVVTTVVLLVTALWLSIGWLEQKYGTRDLDGCRGLMQRSPAWSLLWTLTVWLLIAGPPGGMTIGFLAGCFALGTASPFSLPLLIAGWGIGAWMLIWTTQRILTGRLREPVVSPELFRESSPSCSAMTLVTSESPRDLSLIAILGIKLLLGGVIVAGLAPFARSLLSGTPEGGS